MTQRTRSTALAALALALATLLALATPAAAQDPAPNVTGTVSGGGQPIPGATVTVLDAASAPVGEPYTTGLDGVFAFTLPDGAYRLEVTAACFEPATAPVDVPPGASDLVIALTPTTLAVTASADPVAAPTDTLVRFTAAPAGACGDVTYEWDLDGDDGFDDAFVPDPTRTYAQPGSAAVRVRVRDSRGATATSEPVVVTAENRLPTAGPVTADPARPQEGALVTLRAPAADPEGPLARVEWDFDGDGTYEYTQASPDAPPPPRSFPAGTTKVEVRVTDANEATATASLALEVNARPRLGPITASPAAPVAGDAVTFRTTAADAEGRLDAVEWDLDEDGQFDDAIGLTATVGARAPRTAVRVRARDRDGGSATAELVLDVRERPVPPPPPQPRPPEPQPPTVVDPPRDTTAPAYTARSLPRQRLKTMRKRGLRFAVRCSEACTAYLEVLVDRRTARRLKIDRRARTDVRVGRAKVRLTAAGTRTASIKLTRKARAALKKPPRKMRLTVQGSAWDAGGYTSLLAPRRLTVKR